jgi:uncharacterized protein YjiK
MLTAVVDAFPLQHYSFVSSQTDLSPAEDEWSGLAYWKSGTDEAIFALAGDNGAGKQLKIVKLDLDGSSAGQTITLTGFRDPEGLTWKGGNTFALIEERSNDNSRHGSIYDFTITTSTTSISQSAPQNRIDLDDSLGAQVATGNNLGPEGLAYSHYSDLYYIVKEETSSAPKGIYTVNPSNGTVAALITTNTTPAIPAGLFNLTDIFYGRG